MASSDHPYSSFPSTTTASSSSRYPPTSSKPRHLVRYNPANPSHRPSTLSELSILQKHHQFIRDEKSGSSTAAGGSRNGAAAGDASTAWEDKLAESWYSKLFREYALIDLTQYKTGQYGLRWRVEEEVLERRGELTCGSLHCRHHFPTRSPPSDDEGEDGDDNPQPLVNRRLTPYQLNFRYQEQGQVKQALVKVVLCPRCSKKLTWKKDREKRKAERGRAEGEGAGEGGHHGSPTIDGDSSGEDEIDEQLERQRRDPRGVASKEGDAKSRTRSRSPERRHEGGGNNSLRRQDKRQDKRPETTSHRSTTATASLTSGRDDGRSSKSRHRGEGLREERRTDDRRQRR